MLGPSSASYVSGSATRAIRKRSTSASSPWIIVCVGVSAGLASIQIWPSKNVPFRTAVPSPLRLRVKTSGSYSKLYPSESSLYSVPLTTGGESLVGVEIGRLAPGTPGVAGAAGDPGCGVENGAADDAAIGGVGNGAHGCAGGQGGTGGVGLPRNMKKPAIRARPISSPTNMTTIRPEPRAGPGWAGAHAGRP